ncbi:MAG: hypothetical protein IPI65_17635 [Bacteroidetes bacterium]|nr:hypothetical protein [Bacteroidota bacterium]
MNTDLVLYYKDRAEEYEKIYSKPERQEDLKSAATILQEIFADKQVLEIACGTGYWTEKIAVTATSILRPTSMNLLLKLLRKRFLKQASFVWNC